jgi:branched-chain amino acid transport system substrate-binding protein
MRAIPAFRRLLAVVTILAGASAPAAGAEPVKIGLNYPKTGPYFQQGLDQLRAAQLAQEEINAAGGILRRRIELVVRDSQSNPEVSRKNATEMIESEGVKAILGGASTGVALAVGQVAQEKGVPFFATLTYGQETTGAGGHRFVFRECYDSTFGANITGRYLNAHFKGKKYFYITSNYSWGITTEDAFRKATGTEDTQVHKSIKTPFPIKDDHVFREVVTAAHAEHPDVLVVILFGTEMVRALNVAASLGMKEYAQIVVPAITDHMAEGVGAKNMENVIAPLPWSWKIPYKYGWARGQKFVQDFSRKYGSYPTTSGASAYTILWEYKAAVERAKSFDGARVVKALEDHKYTLLKDQQYWRKFDHQSVQTVFLARGNPAAVVEKDPRKYDFFEIIDRMPGDEAAITRAQWTSAREAAGKPASLEPLPGEVGATLGAGARR